MIRIVKSDQTIDAWKKSYSEALFFTTCKNLVSSHGLDSVEEDLPISNSSKVTRKSTTTKNNTSNHKKSYDRPSKSVSGSQRLKQLNFIKSGENFDVNNLGEILERLEVPTDGSEDDELAMFATSLFELDKNLNRFHDRPCAACDSTGH